MVVDDDLALRLLLREVLEQAGFAVVEAADGAAGLERFQEVHPDVVLLDVEMPEMDGFALCGHLRALPQGTHVPIIMVTGLDDVASIERAYTVGATDFITKPINWFTLAHHVRYLLRASQAFDASRRSEAKTRTIISALPDSLFRLTADGTFLDCWPDRDLAAIVTPERLLGRNLRQVVPAAVAARAMHFIAQTLTTGQRQLFEFSLRGGGTRRAFEARLVVSGDDEVLAVMRDVTEHKKAEARIRHLAYYDELTALPNRRFMHETIRQMIKMATRGDRSVAILLLDIDLFKRINDTLGHSAGDVLLQEVATRIAGCVRDSDCVSRDDGEGIDEIIARFGGDEFIVALPEVGRSEEAAIVAQRILDSLAKPIRAEGHEVCVTASIGIALFPEDGEDVGTLLKNADTAMYQAKNRGRNTYQFYTREMNARAMERLSLEGMLRKAVDLGQLRLHYQPQVEMATRRIVGVEALVRWQHPEMGLVVPGRFIPLAVESGLIVSIGEWVLREACTQSKQWQEAGLAPLRMAVNLSSRQFRHEGLIESVAHVLAESRLDPALLELEITESDLMADVEQAVGALHSLKEMGLALAIDDFGTGYSSLAYLKRFPVDTLKIDRAFVRNLPDDPEDAAIAMAITALGRALDLDILAEGVESEEQVTYLREVGCVFGQGYLFSCPLPAPEITALLEAMVHPVSSPIGG
jgi:diguanylate cyclase (GGDEF)-like protein/PAS domain S-box-containing protein